MATASANTKSVRTYSGVNLERVAFPLGGMGSGMLCMEGNGGFTHLSLRHQPEYYYSPWFFAGICVKGKKNVARMVEGPVASWKVMFPWPRENWGGSGGGASGTLFGLPRFRKAQFSSRFPFGKVSLSDPDVPLNATVTGWSPFIPNDIDNSALPAIGVEYTFKNSSKKAVECVFSFHSKNLVRKGKGNAGVRSLSNGMMHWQTPEAEKPWLAGWSTITTDEPGAVIDAQWFRGGWYDPQTMIWKNIQAGAMVNKPSNDDGEKRDGASIYILLKLKAGEERTIKLRLCWYVPDTDVRTGFGKEGDVISPERPAYKPWYSKRFSNIDQVTDYWKQKYDSLQASTKTFADCFYDTNLPGEVVEAISANLSILKSPSILRLHDGRAWIWEGCCDGCGCCHGSCTHVLNYAQAMAHLFPAFERTLRNIEFNENQDERGHQNFRAKLPVVKNDHTWHAASDGQLGGIMKIYRDWRILGDMNWLREYWPKVKQSINYCIETWDPRHHGLLEEPHHNTYDIEFWGPDGMCTSFYLGALRAASAMAKALNDDSSAYDDLYAKGRAALEKNLYNGEFFIQKVEWENLNAANPAKEAEKGIQMNYSPEALELLKKEGPKYQYGTGCLSDGVLGAWMAWACGLEDEIIDKKKLASHLRAIYKYNFKPDLSDHANPQRPSYALGSEGGLLLCSWPRGGALSLPFPYSNEVWTGIEYQVAAHLMSIGEIDKGLKIVNAVRARYNGNVRNPYDEYECGHWYTRALASYSMLQALTGVRYDAVEKTLYVNPKIKGDFKCFLSTATGFGTVIFKKGIASIEVKQGKITVDKVLVHGKAK